MATPEQADAVLNNPAFKETFEILEKDYTDAVLNSQNAEEAWKLKLRYDALLSVHWELERKLNRNTSRDGNT